MFGTCFGTLRNKILFCLTLKDKKKQQQKNNDTASGHKSL